MLPKCNGTITIQELFDVRQVPSRCTLCASRQHIEHVQNTNLAQRNGLPSPQNAQSHFSFDCFLSWLCTLLGGSGPGRPVR